MKKIKDQFTLTGQLEEITASDLRRTPGEVLSQVDLGKTFIIARNGKSLAILSRIPGITLSINVDRVGKIKYIL